MVFGPQHSLPDPSKGKPWQCTGCANCLTPEAILIDLEEFQLGLPVCPFQTQEPFSEN